MIARPDFAVGQVVHLTPKGAAWTIVALDEDEVQLRSEGGRTRTMSTERLWRAVDVRGWQDDRDRQSQGSSEVVEPQHYPQHVGLVVQWERPVLAWVDPNCPAAVEVVLVADNENQRWIDLRGRSPEDDDRVFLGRASALELAAELTRLTSMMP